jgi:outer membrane murein-binding lipoprotein Lpp
MGAYMKELCLLAVIVASIAGCASTPGMESDTAKKERLSDAYIPVGTAIPRKRTEQGAAPAGEINKQALENDRMTSSANRDGG